MVKNKGFTLIEFMVVFAITAIIFMVVIAGLGNCKNKKVKLNNNETLEEMIDMDEILNGAPAEYIRRDLRTTEQVKMVRHDDGTLWACKINSKDCAMVSE